jgi:hypothetical protein
VGCPTSTVSFGVTLSVITKTALFTGFSDDLNYDINDPGMETIELCDEVKLDESCVIVEPSELYAVSHRARKFRSYRVLPSLIKLFLLYLFEC